MPPAKKMNSKSRRTAKRHPEDRMAQSASNNAARANDHRPAGQTRKFDFGLPPFPALASTYPAIANEAPLEATKSATSLNVRVSHELMLSQGTPSKKRMGCLALSPSGITIRCISQSWGGRLWGIVRGLLPFLVYTAKETALQVVPGADFAQIGLLALRAVSRNTVGGELAASIRPLNSRPTYVPTPDDIILPYRNMVDLTITQYRRFGMVRKRIRITALEESGPVSIVISSLDDTFITLILAKKYETEWNEYYIRAEEAAFHEIGGTTDVSSGIEFLEYLAGHGKYICCRITRYDSARKANEQMAHFRYQIERERNWDRIREHVTTLDGFDWGKLLISLKGENRSVV